MIFAQYYIYFFFIARNYIYTSILETIFQSEYTSNNLKIDLPTLDSLKMEQQMREDEHNTYRLTPVHLQINNIIITMFFLDIIISILFFYIIMQIPTKYYTSCV